jgi:pilus assembly protein CpaC
MTKSITLRHRLLSGAMAATLSLIGTNAAPGMAQTAPRAANASADLLLSVGRGRLITLPSPMSDVFVANQAVADVQVRSPTQVYVFGKSPGETSIYCTDAGGRVVYSTVARVGNNIETIDQMLTLAMPDAQIAVNTMNGFVLLTGTVRAPEDAAEADRLVAAFVGEGTRVISRLQTATPLQVNLQVRISEVNRSVIQNMGGNLLSRDSTSGMVFGAFRGRDITGAISTGDGVRRLPVTSNVNGSVNVAGGNVINPLLDAATFAVGGTLGGMNLLSVLDLAERTGMVVTLAQPNLTTVSGESADFLAGGEYPIPVPDPLTGSVIIQYRKFGVSLAYTPTVLSNGRISLRVRPEVSELSTEGAIRLQGYEIPALTIRRAETTVELGSGESFMIAGLMNNRSIGTMDRTPGAGDIPILGMLFKSDNFRRGDTELVIVVTPYLVRPVNSDQIVLPTDGYRNATDMQRMLFNRIGDGQSEGERGSVSPGPTLATTPTNGAPTGTPNNAPGMLGLPASATPNPQPSNRRTSRDRNSSDSAAPGFGFGG